MKKQGFFSNDDQIPDDLWEEKYKELAEKYDKKELDSSLAPELELTSELLKKIAEEEKKEMEQQTRKTNS